MGEVIKFQSKDEQALEEATRELREAKEAMNTLTGQAYVDAQSLKRLILAQSEVTRLRKLLFERAQKIAKDETTSGR